MLKINQNSRKKMKRIRLLLKQTRMKSKMYLVWIKNSGNVIYSKRKKKLLLSTLTKLLHKAKEPHQSNKLKEIKTKYYLVFSQNKVTLTHKFMSSCACG